MFAYNVCCVMCRQRSPRRADHYFSRVLPGVCGCVCVCMCVCVCVCARARGRVCVFV